MSQMTSLNKQKILSTGGNNMSAKSKMFEIRAKVILETIECGVAELSKLIVDQQQRINELEEVTQLDEKLPATLSPTDVAKYLGISRMKVYDMLAKKSLKGSKEGSAWLIFREDFEEYISQKRA